MTVVVVGRDFLCLLSPFSNAPLFLIGGVREHLSRKITNRSKRSFLSSRKRLPAFPNLLASVGKGIEEWTSDAAADSEATLPDTGERNQGNCGLIKMRRKERIIWLSRIADDSVKPPVSCLACPRILFVPTRGAGRQEVGTIPSHRDRATANIRARSHLINRIVLTE